MDIGIYRFSVTADKFVVELLFLGLVCVPRGSIAKIKIS